MNLHEMLDWEYGEDGDNMLGMWLEGGADIGARFGPLGETPLHVAARRRRASAVEILLEHGAEIDARTDAGKTAYAHALRRGFADVVEVLVAHGADTKLAIADQFALAVTDGRLDEARALLKAHPGSIKTGNPEEDRLLADMAGREALEPVTLLIKAGADLRAPGLDDGTPLHQAAWFGQPENARALIAAGAPLEVFDSVHESSPLGWVVHGSRYAGGAEGRADRYVALARLLLEAGASLCYPDDPGGTAYRDRLLADARPGIAAILRSAK